MWWSPAPRTRRWVMCDVATCTVRPAPAVNTCSSSTPAAYDEHLRILLSRMYEFNRSWLPVMDAERVFLGEVTQESIAEYLSSGKSRGGKTSIVSPAETALA